MMKSILLGVVFDGLWYRLQARRGHFGYSLSCSLRAQAAELCHFLQDHFGVEPGVGKPRLISLEALFEA